MRYIRAIAVGLAILSALVLGGLAWLFGTSGASSDTFKKNREIEISFQAAASFVDGFLAEKSRLPSAGEFAEWRSQFSPRPYTPKGMELVQGGEISALVEKEYGKAPANGYVIWYWRGEWEEVYVSWAKSSSLQMEMSKFYSFNNRFWQSVAFLVALMAIVAIGWYVWPRGRFEA